MPFVLAPVAAAVLTTASVSMPPKAVAVTDIDARLGRVTQVTYDGVQTYYPIRVCKLEPQYYTENGRPVGVREVCSPY